MKWTLPSIARFAIASTLVTTAALGQRPKDPTGTNFHKLLTIDSAGVRSAALSPNGRWLIVDKWDDAIWIASADGHGKLARLLSPGYKDEEAAWFLSSDRLVFLSNRPSREGPTKRYVMTVELDSATGKAVGAPRQITTEEAVAIGRPSPDGHWVLYVTTDGKTLKVAPVTGGTPRTLASADRIRAPILWTPDGKTVYFPSGTYPFSPKATWFTVAAAGGRATPVARAPDIYPSFANPDQRVRLTYGKKRAVKAELLDATNRAVGVIDVPAGVVFSPSIGGVLGYKNDAVWEVHVVSIPDAKHRLIPNPERAWVDAWTADGAGFIVDGNEPGPFVAMLDTAGHLGRRVMLPPDASAMGFAGTVGYASTFSSGPTAHRTLYSADTRSGAIRELASPGWTESIGLVSGPGGDLAKTPDRILVARPNGNGTEIRAFSADGTSELLRTLPKSDSIIRVGVHGDRVAWAVRARDSIIVFAARGPRGAANRLLALRVSEPRHDTFRSGLALAWSRDGNSLALLEEAEHPPLVIAHITPDARLDGTPRFIQTGARAPWCLSWVNDDRAVAFIGYPGNSDKSGSLSNHRFSGESIIVVPMATTEQPTVLPNDGKVDEWFFVSPDRKQIVYPNTKVTGSAIWRMDFVPPQSTTSAAKPKP